MRKLKHSVVVVTGGSSGIGRAAALDFAERGAAVVVTARREQALAGVVQECRDRGTEALAVPADVSDAAAVEEVARETVGRFGRLDVWVNNAGVNLFARLEEAPVDAWHRVVETNVFGTYHGLRAAIPWMREQASGVLINVSSVLGKVGSPYQSAYVASKHAVRALSDCVRQELLDVPGISVCTVLPGPVDTPLFDHAGNYTGRQVKTIKPVIPVERAAAAIVACARRPRREVIVGASTAQTLGLDRLAPALVERLVARQVRRDHFGDMPAPPDGGNLLAPADDSTSMSGGWTRGARKVGAGDARTASNSAGSLAGKALVALGAVGATAAGAAGVAWLRRE